MADKDLINFIKEARKRGYTDSQIKMPLLKKGWPLNKVEAAFASLNVKHQFKNRVCLFLDPEILGILEKRADKNLFTISEQIEDILRRSCVNQLKKKPTSPKINDLLVSIFSRRKYVSKKRKH